MKTTSSSRRRFLRTAGVIGASYPVLGASLGSILTGARSNPGASAGPLAPRSPHSLDNHVVVIGAGLAGLAAASELKRAGHRVTVLEARTRPGGRVHTLHDPFADNLYSEVGAVAFSEAYTTANRYIDELGLSRLNYAFPDQAPLYYLGGQRFSTPPDAPVDWPYDLTDEEASAGPIGLVVKYLIQTLPTEISDPDAWNSPALRQLDEISLAEYMRRQGASEGAIQLVANTQYFGRAPEEASALSIAVTDIGLFFMGASMFVLDGGNDRLPTAMASNLSGIIQYGVDVEGIAETETGVEVVGLRNNRPFSIAGDRVILTVPASVMKRIRIEPNLPAAKQKAIGSVIYRDIVRAQFQVRSAFWREEGVSGSASTDLFGGRIDRQPYSDVGSGDRRAILEAFVEGPEAVELAEQSDDEILESALADIEKVHPAIRDYAEGGVVKAWSADPYTMGGWSWAGPGDVTGYLEELQRPSGRIHFAGEHTSILRATMEGALRSGERTAREVDVAAMAED